MLFTDTRIEIANAAQKAVFVHTGEGWTPDWFYEDERRMLRFKDHEWLSLGHVHPGTALRAARKGRAGVVFDGQSKYGTTDVAWQVTVEPDRLGSGFLITTEFRPAASLELLEAHSTFELPYEYDGSETVTTVIGQNPVVRWQGQVRVSPPLWNHPAWLYSRAQAARCTGPCNTPLLCQAIAGGTALPARHTTILGDWNVCRTHDVYATPTRPEQGLSRDIHGQSSGRHGYKFVVGALNWSSAYSKDPNVLFAGGKKHRQRVLVDFATECPGGSFDAMLMRAWERTAQFDIPTDGRVAAIERAAAMDVTWQSAVAWLRSTFCGAGTEGLFLPDRGICTYAEGTRPKAGGDYSWSWWIQWAGLFHYRAYLFDDRELQQKCDDFDTAYARAASAPGILNAGSSVVSLTMLPSLWWAHGAGHGGPLAQAMQPLVEKAWLGSRAENGQTRRMDHGAQAASAEGLLVAAEVYGADHYREQGLILLSEINAQLDDHFWDFNCGETGSLAHGGQMRPMGVGHAVLANFTAWRQTKDAQYLTAARRFQRYLVSVLYTSHNGSADPDFDWRGWANGSNGGRDQIAEFPPWETCNGFMYPMALMLADQADTGLFDTAWYFARTGLAQFPAARTLKRVLDQNLQVRFVPRASVASERDFYDCLPYLAYENPHDQTLLASYQGTDCLLGELAFGGGLATADDPRLGVFVPAAVLLDPVVKTSRQVVVWNPLPKPVASAVHTQWADSRSDTQTVTVPPRSSVKLEFHA